LSETLTVAVLGAGGTIAPPIVRDLAESPEVSALKLLDLDGAKADATLRAHGGDKSVAIQVDGREEGALESQLSNVDILVNAAARPGVECGSIDAAARKVVTDAGYGPDYKHFTHRLGHGMGMDGHEWPYLVRGNPTLLRANMTTSNEPGIYIRGEFGVRIEDDMHITESGAELFTPQTRSLENPFGKA